MSSISQVGMWVAAAAPILLLVVLLTKLQWSAAKAALLVVGVDAVIALLVFRAHIVQVLVEAVKGLWSSLGILIIIWPAILIYGVVCEAKAFQVIRRGMQKATPNELLQVLIIGYVFAGFLQGITGFGVPVAICAPLLIGIGVSPLWALVLSLLGQAWGNTFGTLSAAWDALAAQAALTEGMPLFGQSAFWAAVYLLVINLATGLVMCWFYGRGRGLVKGLPAVLLLSLIQGGGELLLSQVNTTLCCFIPCCAALLAAFVLGRTPLYNKPWKIEESRIMVRQGTAETTEEGPHNMNVLHAFSPYLVLTVLTLICLLVPAVKGALNRAAIGLSLPAFTAGGVGITEAVSGYSPISLTNAGFFLLLAAGFGYLYFRRRGWIASGAYRMILRDSAKKTLPSAVSIIAFLMLANIMSGTGQTATLAGGFAAVFGEYYAVLAALVGMLGSFLTGSNMSSNILFCGFQMTTAQMTGISSAQILAAQTVGGSIGSMISPSKIVLGATTAGILGAEGKVLKKLLPIALIFAALVGGVVLLICTLA